MNGITYYQTRSPYRGDFTKNCSLNGFEIDSNFLNLEGRDIRRMYTRGCTLYAELYNGETISTSIDSCGGGGGSGSCDCDLDLMTFITWSELRILRDNSQLVPGMQYRITDYECTTVQDDTDSAHHPFDIIVFADDEHMLNENARATVEGKTEQRPTFNFNGYLTFEGVRYDVETRWYYDGDEYVDDAQQIMSVWLPEDPSSVQMFGDNPKLYTLQGVTDIQDIMTDVYININHTVMTLGTFFPFLQPAEMYPSSGMDYNNPIVVTETYFKNCNLEAWELKYCLDNDTSRFEWAVDNDGMKLLLSSYTYYEDGVFYDNGHNEYKYQIYITYSRGNNIYYYDNNDNNNIYLRFTLTHVESEILPIGRDISEVYIKYDSNFEIDGLYNSGQDVLVVINDSIISFKDYIDSLSFGITSNQIYKRDFARTNQTFNFVLDPAENDKYTCSELSDIVVYSDYGSNLISMQLPIIGSESRTENLIQIPDNGIMLYAVMGYYTQGKGVIYYMKDDRNNELPYDFKNIMFKRTIDGSDVMLYTFTQTVGGTISDASVYKNSSSKEGVFENIINPYYTDYNNSVRRTLNQNVFYTSGILKAHTNRFGDYCFSNTFGNGCISNRFGDYCYSNTFGDNCNYNTFDYGCFSNVFGDNCYSDTFGDNCNYNTFGNGCFSNVFGDNCSSNVFADNCHFNVFGDFCYSNTFGDNCNSNTFGFDCFSNTFDDGCFSNRFGNGCYSNVFGDNCSSNVFADKCSEIIIEDSNQNTIDNIRYIHVFNNVSGNIYTDSQGNNLIQYDSVLRTPTYTQYVGKDTQGNLLIWNPADLVPHPLPSNNS